MKIILPTAGSVPDQRTVGYVINIAKGHLFIGCLG